MASSNLLRQLSYTARKMSADSDHLTYYNGIVINREGRPTAAIIDDVRGQPFLESAGAWEMSVIRFSVAITISALGVGLLGGSVVGVLQSVGADLPSGWWTTGDEVTLAVPLSGIEAFLVAITSLVVGVLLLTALLHLARLVGRFHGKLAKRLLVAA